ncbi:putative ABC transport system permease protein [Desulfocicer vacuolatum DSM 3385]|uniref:Putative ABC transport system permease protein n=1 Tax=Desulfocicer vacuolatum DSM 3385 TaxID=1121400 RepID=A0A1W2DYD0_9BACT|nr:FtsX-like permease family protein [Desulfocicer vacuolatum]SMD01848.1 putative ABC transport system permease protein [Desulfocicer vacuolatum DSM 3385]
MMMPPGILIKTALKYSKHHRARTLLLILGIALGVSGVVAIDIAKTSVSKSFELSTGLVTGKATHRIVGTTLSLSQSLFTTLKVSLGIKQCAPVISKYPHVKELREKQMQLLGIDPFSENAFRSLSLAPDSSQSTPNLAKTLMSGDGVLLSQTLARENNLAPGDTLTLVFGKKQVSVHIAGFLHSTAPLERLALTGILVTDIATAQEISGMGDRISHIDLILDSSQSVNAVKAILPKGSSLVQTARNNRAVRNLSQAFETSLTAFSMLALFMGMFLIYNTVSFSVTQRQRLTGILRSLGATQRDIFMMVTLEVFIYGIAGSLLGILVGIILGKGAVHAVCTTVSDMYFVLTVNQTHIAWPTLVKGFSAGMVSCVAATLFPALTASRIPPVTLSRRSTSETRLQGMALGLTLIGILLLGLAFFLFVFPHTGASLDFLGIFMMFTGASFMVPLLTRMLIALLLRLTAPIPSLLTRMALNNIVRSLSRTSVLIASLMVVTAVYIGIDTMTVSFRQSVVKWIDDNIGGDIHVRCADKTQPAMDASLVKEITTLPGVEKVSAYAMQTVLSERTGKIHVFAYATDQSQREWIWTASPQTNGNTLPSQGRIQVSEIFAARHGIVPGQGPKITLNTLQGLQTFPVTGIFRDFFMGGGRIIVHPQTLKTHWGFDGITSLQLFLNPDQTPGQDVDSTIKSIRSISRSFPPLEIRSGKILKQSVLDVFDNTFMITTALQFLTAIVALTGIINAVMALLLERSREMAILRSWGAESVQVAKLLLLECGYAGFIAGICALPFGLFLSWVLIDVINKRSFGWTYDMVLQPRGFLTAVAMAIVAAVVAGILPAVKAGQNDIPTALRME